MKFIVLSIVLLAIAGCASTNKVTLWGTVTNTLITSQTVNAPSAWFMIVSRTVALDARVKITGIEIIDNLERSSTFAITRGGIGAKKASIQIDSARGAGISVVINFYAQNSKARHKSRKNLILVDSAKNNH